MTSAARKVWLVDDDADLRAIAGLSLAKFGGWQVRALASAAECLALADGPAPDLIILDVRLPDLSGAALLAKLKAMPRLQAVPIVFLTAADGEGPGLLAAGAAGVLAKPFDPLQLPQQLERLLAARSG